MAASPMVTTLGRTRSAGHAVLVLGALIVALAGSGFMAAPVWADGGTEIGDGTLLPGNHRLFGNTTIDNIGFDQRLNEQVPLDLQFQDEAGQTVHLSDYVNKKPVILSLGYYECPMLCSLVREGVLTSLRGLNYDAGNQFQVLMVSIDPRETPAEAAEKKAHYTQLYNRPGADAGWHFLVGQEASIQKLAAAVGFRYAYDESAGQYAHPSGIVILTPQGRISRYFLGIDYPTRDMRLALGEASNNQIGSPVDQLLLLCYHYNPDTGKYSLAILSILRWAGLLFVLVGGILVYIMFRHERPLHTQI